MVIYKLYHIGARHGTHLRCEGLSGKVLKMDGPSAQGFLSLTGPLAPRVVVSPLRAMNIKSALRDWLSVSYVTQYPVPLIFSFPLEGNSREAGKGVRGKAPIGCSITVLTANRILLTGSLRSPPPIRLRRTSPAVRSVNRKEGPFMGRLGALLRPTCTSYAGCAQWTIKL